MNRKPLATSLYALLATCGLAALSTGALAGTSAQSIRPDPRADDSAPDLQAAADVGTARGRRPRCECARDLGDTDSVPSTPTAASDTRLDLRRYAGVDPTGTTDSTAGIAAALAQACAKGQPTTLLADAGTYLFSSLAVPCSGLTLQGEGVGTRFLQTSPTADGLVIGRPGGAGNAGARITNDVTIRNVVFDTKPGVVKTGGSMIAAYYTNNLLLENVHVGTKTLDILNPQHHSFDGITLAGLTQAVLRNVEVQNAANDCFTAYSLPDTPQRAPATDYGSELHVSGQINVCGRYGIHIAGGLGGVYFESGGEGLATSYGVLVDRSLDPHARPNPQITFGQNFAVDSNGADGIFVGPGAAGDFFFKSWSSSNKGAGLRTDPMQTPYAHFIVSAGHFENNGSHGLVAQGGMWTIGGGTDLYGNGTKAPTGGSGVFVGRGILGLYASDFSATGNGVAGGAGYGVDDEGPAGKTVLGPAYYAGNKSGNYRSLHGLGFLVIASPH